MFLHFCRFTNSCAVRCYTGDAGSGDRGVPTLSVNQPRVARPVTFELHALKSPEPQKDSTGVLVQFDYCINLFKAGRAPL